MRRRNWGYSAAIAYFIAWIGVQVMPGSVYGALTGLNPIEGLPDSALRFGITFGMAGLVFLAIIAVTLVWESRSGVVTASRDAPTDDSQAES